MSNLRKKALHGMAWTMSQQLGVQFINFSVSIILARLLLPEEFGLIGMISIFIMVGNSLVDSGMTSSLIRTPKPDNLDYSTVFFTNLSISVVAYFLLFAFAPLIAVFFGKGILTNLIKVYSLIFIIRAFSTVQSTKLNKEMNFKTQMLINIPSLILGGLLGVFLAYNGFGVWAIVYMNLFQAFIATTQLWIRSKWHPTFEFNWTRLKYHLHFGYKVTLSGLLNTFIKNLNNIIIGRYFSAAQLGYFTRAKSMQELPVDILSSALNKVTYPLFSSIMHDDLKLKSAYRKLVQQVFFITAPLLITAIVIAEPLFRFVLTEKWLPSVPYFQIMCLAGIVTPLNSYNLNILLVKGKSDQYLKLETFKNVVIILGTFLVIPFGIFGLIWNLVLVGVITFFMNAYFCGKIINISVKEQMMSILPVLLLSCGCVMIAYILDEVVINYFFPIDLIRILIISAFSIGSYTILSYWFKLAAMVEILTILKIKKSK